MNLLRRQFLHLAAAAAALPAASRVAWAQVYPARRRGNLLPRPYARFFGEKNSAPEKPTPA
jgi:hypothetical protein